MREILFKAKRIDNGEWVEGCLITRKYAHTDEVYEAHIVEDAYEQLGVLGFGIHPVLISPLADKYVDGCFRVDINTICQYTGLTDKNGNKIWENDVLKIARTSDSIGEYYYPPLDYPVNVVVKWDLCAWMWETIEKRKHYISFPDAWCHYEAEVIGNIFDNAELLERVVWNDD